MPIRAFSAIYGIVFLLAGLSGFIPGLSPAHLHRGVTVTAASRLAMGLFPVNVLHDAVHFLFGVWGLLAARSFRGARLYARAVAIIYALLAVMGLVPGLDTTFGLIPISGNDVWLHAGLAVVAGFFGFLHREATIPVRTMETRQAERGAACR